MSEPLSAVEIEDVLSSIRRLVSEDLRPATRGAVNPSSGLVEDGKPALILTPALRVVPESVPLPEIQGTARPVQEVVASVGAAATEQGHEWEPETGDAILAADTAWPDAAWDEAPAMAPSGGADLAPRRGDGAATETDEPSAAGWIEPGLPDAESVAATEATPSTTDAEWLANAEAEVIAGLEQSRDQMSGAPLMVPQDNAEMTFDEEVLRDLVRDLIREELQGHLGERITRNIRKLVRAEIARALAVQDLV